MKGGGKGGREEEIAKLKKKDDFKRMTVKKAVGKQRKRVKIKEEEREKIEIKRKRGERKDEEKRGERKEVI